MSRGAGDSGSKRKIFLADTDLFFYLRGGECEAQAERVVREVTAGAIELRASSEVYDDAVSAIRADNLPLNVAYGFVADMKSIPHTCLPMSAEVAEEALNLYLRYGGRRRLGYFESFHVATAKRYGLPLLTSDKYMIGSKVALGTEAVDLRGWKK